MVAKNGTEDETMNKTAFEIRTEALCREIKAHGVTVLRYRIAYPILAGCEAINDFYRQTAHCLQEYAEKCIRSLLLDQGPDDHASKKAYDDRFHSDKRTEERFSPRLPVLPRIQKRGDSKFRCRFCVLVPVIDEEGVAAAVSFLGADDTPECLLRL